MRALITGVNGFVGRHLARHLIQNGHEVVGTTRGKSGDLNINGQTVRIINCPLRDADTIYEMLEEVKPDAVFHLAAQSNVKKSWEEKEKTFYANVNQTLFLLDACVKYQQNHPGFRMLTVGSSEEYGKAGSDGQPIREETPLHPATPYGVTKAAVSWLAEQYYKANGLCVIHARPFNHIGPGQSLGFVVPDFASQIAKIEKGIQKPVLKVGNLEALRDFTDVRDIVAAYDLLLQKGQPGEVYNVCSGNARSIRSLLDIMLQLSSVHIQIETDPEKIRPSDVPVFVGSNEKLRNATGWKPSMMIEKTLEDVLNEFRKSSN